MASVERRIQGAILATPVVLEGTKVFSTVIGGQPVNWRQAVSEVGAMEGFLAIPAVLTVGVIYSAARTFSERNLAQDTRLIKG